MLKRGVVVGLTVTVAAVIFSSCGGGGSSNPLPPPPGMGSLFTLIGDAPFWDILSFRATITGLTLTPMGGGNPVTVISSNTAAIKVNFPALRDFSTILSVASVPEGTYGQATITFSAPQIVVFDAAQSPPIATVTATLTPTAPSVNIQPALTITKGQPTVLRIDFDLLNSIQLDGGGQVTGNVTPVLRLTPFTAFGSGGMDDLLGFVQRVDTFSANPNFIGDFLLQLLSGTGPSVFVNLTSTTQLFGVPALNQLPTGSFVEVDGFIDSNGNLVANSVEVEDREIVEQNMVAFLGYALSVTKDSGGNATQFSLFVREEEPDSGFSVPLDSVVVVNVSPSTVYQFSSRSTNFANLPFDATALAVGQEVVVHGIFTVPPRPMPPELPPPTTVAADKVYVKLQTHQGNFIRSRFYVVGSDNRTGSFEFVPRASLFGPAHIFVFTNSQTAFVNLSGLSALTPESSLLVKGLLFFERERKTINGVTLDPGSLVLLAKQVHQL